MRAAGRTALAAWSRRTSFVTLRRASGLRWLAAAVTFSITAVDGCRSRRLRAVRFSIEPTAELGLEDEGLYWK